jgi:predicted Mrr-cat superfamily restriction endonuclease
LSHGQRVWGLHNDQRGIDLAARDYVSIGWDALGDFRAFADDREELKRQLARAYPSAKAGAVAVWAGMLTRFACEMAIGDLVVCPEKASRTVHIAQITGAFRFESAAPTHRNRRPVRWLATDLPRDMFSQAARYELGSSLTLFRIRRNSEEFSRSA